MSEVAQVMAEPPFDSGALKVTVACVLPPVALTLPGETQNDFDEVVEVTW